MDRGLCKMRKFYAKLGVKCEIEKCENEHCMDNLSFFFLQVINDASH